MKESASAAVYVTIIYFFCVNRNVHGLIKIIWKLLEIQAVQLGSDEDEAVWNLYGIRLASRWFCLDNITTGFFIFRKRDGLNVDVSFLSVFFFVLPCR